MQKLDDPPFYWLRLWYRVSAHNTPLFLCSSTSGYITLGYCWRTRMVKIIMRPHAHSISGVLRAAHGTESGRHGRLIGQATGKVGRCPSPDDCAPDDNGLHTH